MSSSSPAKSCTTANKAKPVQRCAVLVSGSGSNLQALIDQEKQGKMPHVQLALVIASKPGVYALERATQAGIPSLVHSRKHYDSQVDFENALIQVLEEAEIDLIVLAGYLQILSEHFTSRYPKRILNVHPSLIPSFCGKGFYGLRVHEAALEKGVKVTGATVHFVNEIPDGGDILAQKAVYVHEGDDAKRLQQRVMEEAEWILLPQTVERLAQDLSLRKESL